MFGEDLETLTPSTAPGAPVGVELARSAQPDARARGPVAGGAAARHRAHEDARRRGLARVRAGQLRGAYTLRTDDLPSVRAIHALVPIGGHGEQAPGRCRASGGRTELLPRIVGVPCETSLIAAIRASWTSRESHDDLVRLVREAPITALPPAAVLHRVPGAVHRGLNHIEAVPGESAPLWARPRQVPPCTTCSSSVRSARSDGSSTRRG